MTPSTPIAISASIVASSLTVPGMTFILAR